MEEDELGGESHLEAEGCGMEGGGALQVQPDVNTGGLEDGGGHFELFNKMWILLSIIYAQLYMDVGKF